MHVGCFLWGCSLNYTLDNFAMACLLTGFSLLRLGIKEWLGPALCLPLQMTKEDHLTLLRTARGRDAGAALSYARSVTDVDSRFNEAPGDAETAVGFWHAGAASVNASDCSHS